MTTPKPNAELAYRVLDHIDADPRSWRQDVWDCGTAACFAGWAVRLAGGISGDDLVVDGPAELIGHPVGVAAHMVLGIDEDTAWSLYDRGTGDWLFSPDLDREGLGQTVAEIFGPRPPWTAADKQAWRECAHRADYTTPAEHANNCAYHRGEVDEWGKPIDDVPRPHAAESSFAPGATLKDSPDPMYPEGDLDDVPPNAGSAS